MMMNASRFSFALTLTAMLAACGGDSGTSASGNNKTPQKENIVSGYEDHAGASLVDARDGRVYKTVVIGSQIWMAENLNYVLEDGVHSWCYNEDPENCQKYGRMYSWNAAMEACPEGWHLPTISEWQTLVESVGGKKHPAYDDEWSIAGDALKSIDGWKELTKDKSGGGVDSYGFAGLPGGFYNPDGSSKFEFDGTHGTFWASTTSYGGRAGDCLSLIYNSDMARLAFNEKNWGFSVRCLKDN